MFYLLEGRVSTKIIWNPSAWEMCLCLQFLITKLIIYIRMDSWYFLDMLWIIIQCYFIYFIVQIVLSSVIWSCLSVVPMSGDKPCGLAVSMNILCISYQNPLVLESTIYLRHAVSIYWRVSLVIKSGHQMHLLLLGHHCMQAPQQTEQRNRCIYVNSCLYIYCQIFYM